MMWPLEVSLASRPSPSKYSVLARPTFCENWNSALDEPTFVGYNEFTPSTRAVAILSKTAHINGFSYLSNDW